jgi:SAM-dependent methyltransferase
MIEKEIYIHTEDVHNLDSPSIIVPVIINLLEPSSVVDLGCGIGTFLHLFKKHGVNRVLGIDGKWANKELLKKYLSENEFYEANIENKIEINEKFDIAICLEVAEHIDSTFADNIVSSLTNLSDIIIFAAAIPNQGGQNHVNEQYPKYWESKFNKLGYMFIDCFRDIFWDNKNVFWWYRQNMFLVVKEGTEINIENIINDKNQAQSRIHPELYDTISNISVITQDRLLTIEKGDLPLKKYLKLLLRGIKRKFGFKNTSNEILVFDKNNPLQKI